MQLLRQQPTLYSHDDMLSSLRNSSRDLAQLRISIMAESTPASHKQHTVLLRSGKISCMHVLPSCSAQQSVTVQGVKG